MLRERRHVGDEAAEQETAIFLETRQSGEAVIAPVERLRIAAGALPFDSPVLTRAVEGPAMIRADVQPRITGRRLGNLRALVWARIDEGAQPAFAVTHH